MVSEAPRFTIEAVDDHRVENVTLLTLNHDTILEALIDRRPYDDGFGVASGAWAEWHSGNSDRRRWDDGSVTQLVKLHGSVDWWSPVGWGNGGYAIRNSEYPGLPFSRRPLFLVGSGPKLFQSSNLLFAQQIVDAGFALTRATCVVIVGYGFGDVRVNSLWYGATVGAARQGRLLPTVIVDPMGSAPIAVAKTKMNDALHAILENRNSVVGETVNYDRRAAASVSWEDCVAAVVSLNGHRPD